MPETHVHDTQQRRYALQAYYAAAIADFVVADPVAVLGAMASVGQFDLTAEQRNAWVAQLPILQDALRPYVGRGRIYLEFSIPRLGKRVDAIAVIDHVLFVIEFKVGESRFTRIDQDQVWDYALDLRNFHETSHAVPIAPILIATAARSATIAAAFHPADDRMTLPICIGASDLPAALALGLLALEGPMIDAHAWEAGRYSPTPTIVEAARALYANHSVQNISRSDAGAINLHKTSRTIDQIIEDAKQRQRKAI